VSVFIAKHLGVLANPGTGAKDLQERVDDIILYLIILSASGQLEA
jgi:hypothetical protein